MSMAQDGGHLKKLARTGMKAAVGFCTWLMMLGILSAEAQASTMDPATNVVLTPNLSETNLWAGGIGEGFQPGSQSVTLSSGVGEGLRILGGTEKHDLALFSIAYGYALGSVNGEGHFYQGSWELRGELFGGAQYAPDGQWLLGLTPHLRYNFMTGTRWIPYIDIGAGVTATSIGPPDLSNTFEFNLQAASGVRYFITDTVAMGIEAHFLHVSDAGLSTPNRGVNNLGGMLGVSWFF